MPYCGLKVEVAEWDWDSGGVLGLPLVVTTDHLGLLFKASS